jgi:vacuolar iron transporter family protein
MESENIKKLIKQLQVEVDTSYLYRFVSNKTTDKLLAELYGSMADIEEKHAGKVLSTLKKCGKEIPAPGASLNARTKTAISKIFGYDFILAGLMNTEKQIARNSVLSKIKKGEAVTGGELNHQKILENLIASESGTSGSSLSKLEGRHKSVGGNALRAAVMGSNDGLVSNLSLIMGVAGATNEGKGIIITGFAGLLAGAISMALGEWLSVQSSRELFKRQIELETEEIENSEDEELAELQLIYRSKGISRDKAAEMAREVFKSKEIAVETLVREELGIDKNELGGSAWEAALTSFALFAAGAIIPLIPFLFTGGYHAVILSALFSAAGLFVIGAGITLFTGRSLFYSGFRQVLFGLTAAAVTFGIGKLIGTAIAG